MHASPTLLETQRAFLAALYDANAAGPLASVIGNGLAPEARLRIYRHSCEAIQNTSLRTVYPAVLALVGEVFFEQCAHGYRRAYPSRSGNLQVFGTAFADYLASLPALRALRYVPAVARLEWLRQESALAADADALAAGDFSMNGLSKTTRIKLHPSVRLLASAQAVLTLWRYAIAPSTERLELPDAGECVVLWRDEGQVAMAALDAASFACIESLARDGQLARAAAAGHARDANFDYSACIGSFAQRGLLVAGSPYILDEELPS